MTAVHVLPRPDTAPDAFQRLNLSPLAGSQASPHTRAKEQEMKIAPTTNKTTINCTSCHSLIEVKRVWEGEEGKQKGAAQVDRVEMGAGRRRVVSGRWK